jgi:hypothetical protein
MNIYEATVFKVKFQDGTIAQVEEHEYYDLLIIDNQGSILGTYYFVEDKPTTMYFCFRDEKGDECHYILEVVEYMFGYSGEWIEV